MQGVQGGIYMGGVVDKTKQVGAERTIEECYERRVVFYLFLNRTKILLSRGGEKQAFFLYLYFFFFFFFLSEDAGWRVESGEVG